VSYGAAMSETADNVRGGVCPGEDVRPPGERRECHLCCVSA